MFAARLLSLCFWLGITGAAHAQDLVLFSIASDTGDESVGTVFLGVAAAGGVMLIGGFAWMIYLRHSNPYREEIRDLHVERGHLMRDIKRARRGLELSLGRGVGFRF